MKTSRRTKGEGSIIQLTNGKWRARIECEPVDGKRRWLSKSCDTKMEAVKALKVLERKRDDNVQAKEFKGDFPQLVDDYLTHTRLKGLRPRTLTRYESSLAFWSEFFNHRKIESIKVNHVNQGIEVLFKKEHSKSSIRLDVTILAQAFNFAIKCKYITENPVRGAAIPTKSSIKKEKGKLVTISHEEHVRISEVLKIQYLHNFVHKHDYSAPSRFYMIYNLAYTTGMRVSEIAGLQWNDIDVRNKTISINKQLSSKHTLEPPKTESSNRVIEVSDEIIDKLLELKEHYKNQNYKSSEFIFPFSQCCTRPITAVTMSRTFTNLIKTLQFNRHLTFHSIRHTHATELLENKIPITVVSERLGHASIMTTLEIYAHPTAASRHQAAYVCKLAA